VVSGLLGSVSKEDGEKWLHEAFEDKKKAGGNDDMKSETKAEIKKRI
jgi:hypothetical protein